MAKKKEGRWWQQENPTEEEGEIVGGQNVWYEK